MIGVTLETQEFWDAEADTFDDEADHGLRDAAVRGAWSRLLLSLLPNVPASVADLGCGTGSLSVLLAQAGYDVAGLDLSPRMVEAAGRKARATGAAAQFVVGDASEPHLPAGSFDVVLARHVLWALPDPGAALKNWLHLLKTRRDAPPGGGPLGDRWGPHIRGGLCPPSCSAAGAVGDETR